MASTRNRGEQQQYPGQGLEMWSRILTGQEETRAEKDAWKDQLLAAVNSIVSDMQKNVNQQIAGMREENRQFRNGLLSILQDFQKEIDNKLLNKCSIIEHLDTKKELEQKVSDLYSWCVAELEKKEDAQDINLFLDEQDNM